LPARPREADAGHLQLPRRAARSLRAAVYVYLRAAAIAVCGTSLPQKRT